RHAQADPSRAFSIDHTFLLKPANGDALYCVWQFAGCGLSEIRNPIESSWLLGAIGLGQLNDGSMSVSRRNESLFPVGTLVIFPNNPVTALLQLLDQFLQTNYFERQMMQPLAMFPEKLRYETVRVQGLYQLDL